MNNTKITLTPDQLFALAAAVDIALDDFYEGEKDGYEANQETKLHLEGLRAILGEKINSLNN